MLQGGQLSLILQLVKIPLLITVLLELLYEEEPYTLGSCSSSPKTLLWIFTFVFFAIWLSFLKLKKPSEKKYLSTFSSSILAKILTFSPLSISFSISYKKLDSS